MRAEAARERFRAWSRVSAQREARPGRCWYLQLLSHRSQRFEETSGNCERDGDNVQPTKFTVNHGPEESSHLGAASRRANGST